MIKFDVFQRFGGGISFTATIYCAEDTDKSVKLGLAVKWAINNHANLWGANLRGANLWGASLRGANLRGANLWDANLRDANLRDANLWGASLRGANLRGANLRGANLRGANLEDADLRDANLGDATGLNDYVKCIQIDQYAITYTHDILQIGCQRHPISDWKEFDKTQIAAMDGKTALKFWDKYKDWIFQTIDLCPAKPTRAEPSK